MFHSSLRRRQGMTLVEIMIVLSIIGIVSTVLLVNVVGFLESANQDATKITMRNIDQALQTYMAKHNGRYPSGGEGIAAAKNFLANDEIPHDAWDHEFQYSAPGAHGNHPYEVVSFGKDGVEGGDGYNADIHSWELTN